MRSLRQLCHTHSSNQCPTKTCIATLPHTLCAAAAPLKSYCSPPTQVADRQPALPVRPPTSRQAGPPLKVGPRQLVVQPLQLQPRQAARQGTQGVAQRPRPPAVVPFLTQDALYDLRERGQGGVSGASRCENKREGRGGEEAGAGGGGSTLKKRLHSNPQHSAHPAHHHHHHQVAPAPTPTVCSCSYVRQPSAGTTLPGPGPPPSPPLPTVLASAPPLPKSTGRPASSLRGLVVCACARVLESCACPT